MSGRTSPVGEMCRGYADSQMTRNELKAQEERRRLRKLNWLTYGGEREPDTDDDA